VTVVVAPDKFKGSLSAVEVATAVERGLRSRRPDLEVHTLPVADGGDGTVDAALAQGFQRRQATAAGPTGQPLEAAYARSGSTALLEMATVSGLLRLPGGKLDPLNATSRGIGDLVAAAVEEDARQVVLGIGGSACTDGGAGMLQALGARLLDGDGHDLPPGGAALARLAFLDLTAMPAWLGSVQIDVACDVDNPLVGPEGAAAVYGPQKGASEQDVRMLEVGLLRWADVVAATTGSDCRYVAGAGAAGGLGFACTALLGASLRPGVELLLDVLDLRRSLLVADLVIVGEGSLDEQTLRGKAPVGVARIASAAGRRVVGVCGRRGLTDSQARAVGIGRIYALTDLEPDLTMCMSRAETLLERLGERIADAEC
jgi:glycerate kinase